MSTKEARAAIRKVVQGRQRADEKAASAAKRAAGISGVRGTAAERDALLLMALIPRDTRSLTARFFGDPLPGRSALDLRPAR